MSAVSLGYPIRVSNSELQTFKDCRRKWWFAYYRELGLRRGEVSGARSLGTRVHLVMQGWVKSEGDPSQALREVYDHDVNLMLEAGRTDEEVAEVWKEFDLAHAMVTGFFDWMADEGLDDGFEVVGHEEVLEVPLDYADDVYLRGKLDQRVVRKVDGARLFRDFKTVGNLSEPVKWLHLDEQMKTYQLLEFMHSLSETGGEPQWRTDGGLYLMLRKVKRTTAAKPPFYGQLEVHHNRDEIRSMWKRVAKVILEIVETRRQLDQGGDHQYLVPPRPSRDCTWKCDFFPVCGMVDDGSNADGVIDEFYERIDPHERYKIEETKGQADA